MKPGILIIIESDPRLNGRPAEAVRIAAGVGAWGKVDVAVYLRGAAVAVLGQQAEALVDGENYTRYLPLLRDSSRPLYVQQGAVASGRLADAEWPFEEISDEQLAGLAASRPCVLRF